MRFRIITLGDIRRGDVAEWTALAARVAEPNPNADPRFVLPSYTATPNARDLVLAVVESEDGMHLAAPLTRETRLSRIRVAHMSTRGSFMHEFASKNHPLLDGTDPARSISLLVRGLREAGLPDLLSLTVVPTRGALFGALQSAASDGSITLLERGRDERAYASRHDLLDEQLDWPVDRANVLGYPTPHLSGRSRRSIGRFARQIEQDAGGTLAITRHDADDAAIDEFLDLQASGWKGDALRTGPQFRRNGTEDWFRAVVGAFRDDGDLRVVRVGAGGRTVYMIVSFVVGNRQYGFHDVYDERFARSSPGTVGRLAQLGAVFDDPAMVAFDPGMEPYYEQANTVFPSRREYADLLVSGGGVRSRATLALFPIAKRVRKLRSG